MATPNSNTNIFRSVTEQSDTPIVITPEDHVHFRCKGLGGMSSSIPDASEPPTLTWSPYNNEEGHCTYQFSNLQLKPTGRGRYLAHRNNNTADEVRCEIALLDPGSNMESVTVYLYKDDGEVIRVEEAACTYQVITSDTANILYAPKYGTAELDGVRQDVDAGWYTLEHTGFYEYEIVGNEDGTVDSSSIRFGDKEAADGNVWIKPGNDVESGVNQSGTQIFTTLREMEVELFLKGENSDDDWAARKDFIEGIII